MEPWESDAVALLSELVGIDSVNPGLVADAAGEARIAEALRSRLLQIAARDGWRLAADGLAADLAVRLGAALGAGATFDAPYWMEAPLWEAVCPAVICGPNGGGMHAVDEWVDLRQVRAFTTALVEVLGGWSDHGD